MNSGQWDSHSPGSEALALLQATITALHQSIEPAAIRSNVLEVLIAVNHVLYGGEWWQGLGTEYQAWEQIDPDSGDADWFVAAREAIAGYGYELCAQAEHWFSGKEPDWVGQRDTAVGHLVWVSANARGA